MRIRGLFGLKLLVRRWSNFCHRQARKHVADIIADPRLALGEHSGMQAAFEARLQATWGHALDLCDLVVWEAHEAGSWVNDTLRPAANTIRTHAFICGAFCVVSFFAGFFGWMPSRFADEAMVERLGYVWLGMAWLAASAWFIAAAILFALADVVAELRRDHTQE